LELLEAKHLAFSIDVNPAFHSKKFWQKKMPKLFFPSIGAKGKAVYIKLWSVKKFKIKKRVCFKINSKNNL
jgi:hypothetical protein